VDERDNLQCERRDSGPEDGLRSSGRNS
jgi:hypothetical protein